MSAVAAGAGRVEPLQAGASSHPLLRRLGTGAVLVAALVAILIAVPGLRQVLVDLRGASDGWLALAIALELASCASFVVLFRHFFDGLSARRARELAWTEMGSGALLPTGGAGALALGGWLMHLEGIPTEQIVRRSGGLFFLSSAVSVSAMSLAGVLLGIGVSAGPGGTLAWALPAGGGVLVIVGAAALSGLAHRSRGRLASSAPVRALADGVSEALGALRHPSWRLFGAIGYLGFDIAVLGAALHAVHFSPPISVLILGYIIGYLGNLIPVPGSIGVLEGGLAAVLILYGAPALETTAGVLIYHAVAFWIPSLGGLLGYRLLRGESAGELTMAGRA